MRFQGCFPLNNNVTTIDDYRFIFKVIVDQIATSLGKPVAELGIDSTGKSPVHGYYSPCVNKAHPDRYFFDKYEIENTDKYIDECFICHKYTFVNVSTHMCKHEAFYHNTSVLQLFFYVRLAFFGEILVVFIIIPFVDLNSGRHVTNLKGIAIKKVWERRP